MKPRHYILCTVACLILLFAGCFFYIREIPWVAEFSRLPPETMYQEVTGQPLPEGVSNLKAVGRHYFLKRWAWMRFQATDSAINSALRSIEPEHQLEPVEKAAVLKRTAWVANPRHNEQDLKAVQWPLGANPQDFEVYRFSSQSNAEKWLWMGHILIDRRRKTVFIHAGGD